MLRRSLRSFRPVIVTATEALKDASDGVTIALGGFGLCGLAFELLGELNRKGTKNLTLIAGTTAGPEDGTGPLARDKQIGKIITSYVGENKVVLDHLLQGDFEVEFCPLGSLTDRLRAAGAGVPAFYTPTGYGTAVAEGRLPTRFIPGKTMHAAAFSQPRETRNINGKWCTLEMALPADYGFVRAWKADKRGNLVFRGTTQNFNLICAKASKVCIAEVEEIVECGEIDPREVHLPGVYVHRLVKPEKLKRAAEFVVTRSSDGNGAIAGGKKLDVVSRQRIARRAALELKDGMNVNLGVGLPNLVASYIPKGMDVVLQAENGLLGIGPHPLPEEVDPDITNAGKQTITMIKDGASLFDCAESFAMIRGGHMDLTMLGALEVSANGDIASWYLPGKFLRGMGGAMDLVSSGCGTIALMKHTDNDGRSRVLQECRSALTGRGCVDMVITDLAVFAVKKGTSGVNSLVLTELAEGVTLEEVKAKTEASFHVSPDLKTMPLAPALSGR
ncbi:putative mitochondrial succinyl-coa:3-ketoacid-coenzyme a transferase- like protein [Leptomonas pyrrhocoris]|uniref:Succinyl-CoA:3-ketoacid-coenzyme A transferase n=1 Tax=Leptomonas pyrrhocoris TaxID=157538 RepID=A0A0M9G689_LEPPY|nr:putative mitochondrial succinyl-coa:3-ketoacid-coenzyme a transferase- like protein [Leptomonas pyrrhocoris]XP_015661666.1 putative mitochondrial succinyl-coa:3-ketoacid-coenzyme a transferase- like protein [Leptomonas pyrrhocoris]KPA83226.1 putative mitochondrial succinyl-coa:3-ketoacid-coenzyme a transferase- like protein [Leptomonas pyrrhocoris]KPA83227.1 putative mitochondrial succinyl-coa:3-ketoacid-coenzyme a transferase- like protein [Leptomonas pyrrhocoris]|eukprot:XP_015661665.1 putative mitochondrial succinyl-coa:3-ketoacid-coenzyme a transferase- like protein [Leptomonas pyrrhocoris]